MYDWLVVGAGLTGATVARVLADAGKRVLVIDRRGHIAGNCYDETVDGVRVNRYGGHIFHTNSTRVWEWANRFTAFQQYEHRVKVSHNGRVYSFPPNRATYDELGTDDPELVRRAFFDGYTRKQWGDNPPPNVTKRIPFRTTYDDRYFSDRYQGLPIDGYTAWIADILNGIPVGLGIDFCQRSIQWWKRRARRIVYTGPLDELFKYHFGRLAYRSLRFETETLDVSDYQGCPTINYADVGVPYTRILEWKHFGWHTTPQHTVITREYPQAEGEPYYPVNDAENNRLHRLYTQVAEGQGIVTAGRLGSYKYLNMDQACAQGLALAERLAK